MQEVIEVWYFRVKVMLITGSIVCKPPEVLVILDIIGEANQLRPVVLCSHIEKYGVKEPPCAYTSNSYNWIVQKPISVESLNLLQNNANLLNKKQMVLLI
jgi:hypothetical protein